MKLVSLFYLFLSYDSSKTCSTDVCLTWKVDQNRLVITCKVSHLKFRIRIIDPFNNIMAECAAPSPDMLCDAYQNNSTITQNIKTKLTVFEVHGNIDDRVNGNWKCVHGTGRGSAVTQVKALAENESHGKDISTATVTNYNFTKSSKIDHTETITESTSYLQKVRNKRGTTTLWNNITPRQDDGFFNLKNAILTGSIIVGMLIIVIISILTACFCINRLSCTQTIQKALPTSTFVVVNSDRNIEENDDPHYYHINENEMEDVQARMIVTTSRVNEIARRSDTEIQVSYVEILPDTDVRNSYESLRSHIEDNDNHLYNLCPRDNSISVSHDASLQEEQQTAHENNYNCMQTYRSRLHTI